MLFEFVAADMSNVNADESTLELADSNDSIAQGSPSDIETVWIEDAMQSSTQERGTAL